MSINWFPGHMKKTKDLIYNNLKLIDVCVEVLDSRIPISSINPLFNDVLQNKIRIFALNKIDLSDEKRLNEISYFKEKNIPFIKINALDKKQSEKLCDLIKNEYFKKKIFKDKDNDFIKQRPIRVMIVGVPNSGKSTLINTLIGRKVAITGNKAGVTRGKQWIRVREDIDLFDTPGILYPKIEDDLVGYKLAICGSIRNEILNYDDLAINLIKFLIPKYLNNLEQRYKINLEEILKNHRNFEYYLKDYVMEDVRNLNFDNDLILDIIYNIAKNRGFILSKNEIDYDRACKLIVDEFRNANLGKITLD